MGDALPHIGDIGMFLGNMARANMMWLPSRQSMWSCQIRTALPHPTSGRSSLVVICQFADSARFTENGQRISGKYFQVRRWMRIGFAFMSRDKPR